MITSIVCFGLFATLCLYVIYLVIAGLSGHLDRMQEDSQRLIQKLYPEQVHRSKAMAHTSHRYEHHHLGV